MDTIICWLTMRIKSIVVDPSSWKFWLVSPNAWKLMSYFLNGILWQWSSPNRPKNQKKQSEHSWLPNKKTMSFIVMILWRTIRTNNKNPYFKLFYKLAKSFLVRFSTLWWRNSARTYDQGEWQNWWWNRNSSPNL